MNILVQRSPNPGLKKSFYQLLELLEADSFQLNPYPELTPGSREPHCLSGFSQNDWTLR